MRARATLVFFLLSLGISTILGLAVASKYWDRDSVNLSPNGGDALLIYVKIDGGVSNTVNERSYLSRALLQLLPAALEKITDRSIQVPKSTGRDQRISGLEIQWVGDKCIYTYSAELQTESFKSPLPYFREQGEGFKLTSIGLSISFSGDSIASALLTVRMARWSVSESDKAESLRTDATRFWEDGHIEIELGGKNDTSRVTINMETPGTSPGPVADRVPDLLENLSLCVRLHLEAFSKDELADALKIARGDDSLRSLALYVHRLCKIRGRIIEGCAMDHTAFTNGQLVSGSLGSVPIGTGHICYTIFGP